MTRARVIAWFGYVGIQLAPFGVTAAGLLALGWGAHTAAVLAGLFVVRQLTVFVVTAVYHRGGAHRSVRFHPRVEWPLRVWGWLFTGLGVRTWAVVHRWHHATGDSPEAPFSPSRPGGSLLAIGRETVAAHWQAIVDPSSLARFDRDLPDDSLERFVRSEERRWFGVRGVRLVVLVGLGAAVFVALGADVAGAVAAAIVCLPAATMSVAAGAVFVVNGLGHQLGYRSFDTPDTSHNVVAVDWLGFGEALHNNHHARPGSARFSAGRGEVDPGWVALRVLRRWGWVTQLLDSP